MYKEAIKQLSSKRNILQGLMFTLIFLVIYTLVDSFNMSYDLMTRQYGLYLVVINVALNLIMSGLSAFLIVLSTIMVRLKGQESRGSNMSFISVVFGILTYGCTPCVIAFFANFGITFSVIALPLAGLPYKLLSLVLILLGIVWTRYELNRPCKVKLKV